MPPHGAEGNHNAVIHVTSRGRKVEVSPRQTRAPPPRPEGNEQKCVCLDVYQSIHPSIHPSSHPFFCLLTCLSVCGGDVCGVSEVMWIFVKWISIALSKGQIQQNMEDVWSSGGTIWLLKIAWKRSVVLLKSWKLSRSVLMQMQSRLWCLSPNLFTRI